MQTNELIRLYPHVYHMAQAGAWPSIRTHGLLSTELLVQKWELPGEQRQRILHERRPETIGIDHTELGHADVRDQKPLRVAALQACLDDGLSPQDWLHILNERVFFWLQEERLERLLAARAYRANPQLVLTVDTAQLIATVPASRVFLSRINSGSTLYVPPRRGRGTFKLVADYPHPERRIARKGASDVAELCVVGGIIPIFPLVERVEIRGPQREVLYNR